RMASVRLAPVPLGRCPLGKGLHSQVRGASTGRSCTVLRFAVLLALLAVAGCNGDDSGTIKGSGISKTESRPVEKFTAIELDVGRLPVEQSGTESLTVTADDNLLALFTTEVKGGTLHLSVAKGKNFSGTGPVFAVTAATLRSLGINGSGGIQAS